MNIINGIDKKIILNSILRPKYLTVTSDKTIMTRPDAKIIFLKVLNLKLSLDLKIKREEINATKGI